MSAVGVPMEGRGARTDEYVAAMRALWEDEKPAFAGEHVSFEGVDAYPRPVQSRLPVVVGGHSAAAHRRAVRIGEGWYGFALDRAATAQQIGSLQQTAQETGRDFESLEINVSPTERLDAEVVRDYSDMGVDRLVLITRQDLTLDELESRVRKNAPAEIGAEPAA